MTRLVMHDGRPLARTERAAQPNRTQPLEQAMTFEYRDEHRQTLRITRLEPDYPGQTVTPAIWIETTDGAFGGTAVKVPLDHVEEVVAGIRDAARQAAGQTPTTEQPVVGYRDPNNPRVLLCRQHGQSWHAITPVTAEDLPDGGICTFGRLSSNECGRDVLAGQPAVEQPAEAQPADQARAYDNLYAELTRGVSHAQVRHHLITEYRAEVLREAATVLWHQTNGLTHYGDGVRWACERLRRMADEETR